MVYCTLLVTFGSDGLTGQCGLETIGASAALTMSNTEYYVQTAKGVNTNNEIVIINGMLDTFTAVNTLYWMNLQPTPAAAYVPPSTSAAVQLVSSTANDAAAGTGCRTVQIEGLDSTGAAATSTITMSGTTATTATATSYSFINRMTCLTVGTLLRNDGTISLSAGPGIAANRPTIGLTTAAGAAGFGVSRSQNGAYRVPNGKFFILTGITADTYRSAATAATFSGVIMVYYSLTPTGPQILFDRIGLDHDATLAVQKSYAASPFRLPAGSTIWINGLWQVIPSPTSVEVTGVLYS